MFNGQLLGYPVTILIDPGSTANILSKRFVEAKSITTTLLSTSLTTVAFGGTKGHTTKEALGVQYTIDNFTYQDDFYIVKLGNYDAILGMPWMERHQANTIQYDWCKKTLLLRQKNGTVALQAQTAPPTIFTISAAEMKQELDQDHNTDFVAWTNVSKTTTESTPISDPAVQALVEQYEDVFPDDLPAELPPIRAVDHKIELHPGTTPPS